MVMSSLSAHHLLLLDVSDGSERFTLTMLYKHFAAYEIFLAAFEIFLTTSLLVLTFSHIHADVEEHLVVFIPFALGTLPRETRGNALPMRIEHARRVASVADYCWS